MYRLGIYQHPVVSVSTQNWIRTNSYDIREYIWIRNMNDTNNIYCHSRQYTYFR